MNIKNRKVSRFISILLVGIFTFSFLFLYRKTHLLDFFNTDQKAYITLFISFAILLVIVGIYLMVKTIRQFRTSSEILASKHSDLGVYNKVRNPFYSSVF